MSTRYAHIAFSPAAVERQRSTGSFTVYGSKLDQPDEGPMEFDFRAQGFVKSVDSFFMSTVTPDGWPYVQHRGGPRGFLHVLGPNRIGFADLPGNQQFVTLGNLEANNRISLFVIDYPTRTRLKIYGRAQGDRGGPGPCTTATALASSRRHHDRKSPAFHRHRGRSVRLELQSKHHTSLRQGAHGRIPRSGTPTPASRGRPAYSRGRGIARAFVEERMRLGGFSAPGVG